MAQTQTTHGAGPGTVVAGRYRLDSTLASTTRYPSAGGVVVWSADDLQDGGRVRVWTLPTTAALAEDLLDAARRARAVAVAGVVPVLGAGRDAQTGTAWIVLAEPSGRTLRRLLDGQPLPPETARRIVGEAARTLARTGARGLHHTRLTPDHLHVRDDGEVLISGLGIEAARVGDQVAGDAARRADAVGLVRMLHAALTGRWHGPASLAAGLPQAPRLSGAVVGPADLVGGVPNDLDTLCRVTLGQGDDGPLTPQELADQLAPWAPAVPVATAGAIDATGPCRPVTGPIAVLSEAAAATVVALPAEESAGATSDKAAGRSVDQAAGTADLREPAPSAAKVLASAGTSTGATSGPAASGPAASGPTAPGPAAAGPGRVSPPPQGTRSEPVGSIPEAFLPSTSAATLWEWSQTPIHGITIPDLGAVAQIPGVDPLDAAPPGRRASRVVLAFMVALVLGGSIVGVLAVRGLTHAGLDLFSDKPSVNLPPLDNGGKPAPSQSTAALPAAKITKAIALDPQGDDHENDDDAGKAVDSSGSSQWRSDRYRSADFGGLKNGLGLALQLSKGQVRGVVVKVDGEGGKVELRAANGPGLDGSTVVATSDIGGGAATLIPAKPVTSPYLVLWFTRAPQVDGGFRVEVSDVQVR